MWRLTWIVALAMIFYCQQIVEGKCEYNPIGLDNTVDFPAASFVGSTEQASYLATNARFAENGWCADMADGAKTLTIDFKRLFKVCAVKTAGIQYQDGRDSYISSFDVSFSVDGLNWNTYPTTLTNPDKSAQYHSLTGSDAIRVARFMRFAVNGFVEEPCLKVEVYRNKGECASHPIGISDSLIIPDGNIVASSADAGLEAIHARMSDSQAWCGSGSAVLTIDFGESVQVCAIETRGYDIPSNPRFTTIFVLEFSTDDVSYAVYEENANPRIFTRIRGIETEFHSMFEPVTARYMKINGLDNGFCLSVEVYRSDAKGSCYDSTISFFDTSGDGSTDPSFPAVDAVLNDDNKAWCTTASAPGAYLQVDFGDLYAVCAVAVQGLSDGSNNVYPTSFKLSFAYDDTAHEWADMYEEGDSVRDFIISPADGNVIVKRELAISQVAKYIRFYPTGSNDAGKFCLRVAVYGREGGCLRFPVGITDSFIIPDASITATDSDPNFAATKVRMSDPSAWCLLDGQSGSPYLEVDFGEDVLVCAVETRGFDDGGDELYAEEFELSFSTDGSTFTKYTEDSSTRSFRKGNPLGQEIHMLNEPLTAEKMRFEPVTGQGSQICTSLEVYRGDKEGSCYDSVIDSSDTAGDSGTYGFAPASYAVLDNGDGNAWCTGNSAPDAYLQVDFGEIKVVCAVAVQGEFAADHKLFSKSFKLSFATSEVSNEWTQYYEEGGNVRDFIISPADGNVIVKRELAFSQVAKYMRFYPTSSSNPDESCLRVAVYGREGGCLRFPVGISDSFIIPDASITATNSDPSFAATKVRMSDPSAWCLPDGQSGSPYLEVDFGENVVVCAVETRGFDDGGDGLYAQEFELSFAANGGGFAEYREDGATRIFHKGSPTGQEVHMLNEPVIARKVRFEPVTGQGSQICTSLEVYRENTEVSECQVADWSSSLDGPGWSTCGDSSNYNTYIRGFYRNNRGNPDPLFLLEQADCCNPDMEVYNYENPTQDSQECQDVSFAALQGSNVWAVCPTGYFLRGINVRDFAGSGGADPNYLDDITHGRCCRPKHHPNEYGSCYDEDIWSSFDSAGWASCKESFFMTGFYKSNCNFLYCMEELRCCSMTTIQGRCYSETVPFDSMSSDSGTIAGYPATDGILDVELDAWCTTSSYPDAYLQIDFGDLHVVCAVSVQGRYTGSASGPNSFATKFKLAFAIGNTDVWNFYEEDSEDREYVTAPADGDWIVNRRLAKSQMARYIRFYPTETSPSNQACLRVEVYGRKALDVTCNDDGRVVARVARETLGPAINTLNLNDPSPAGCSVDVAADHFDDIEIEFTVAECGTEHAKVGDNIVSTNHITGVAQGGVVWTYDTDFTVECLYHAKDTLWNSFTPLHSVGDGASEDGVLNFGFSLYIDEPRSDGYSGQQLDLNFHLYARVEILSNPDYLTTMIDRCWSTPSSDRNDATSYDLIVNSCNVGSEAYTNYDCNTADTIQDFDFKAFRFSQDSGSTYLHCNVRACLTGPASECYQSCTNACNDEKRKRRSFNRNSSNASTNPYPEMYFLDFGPIRVTEEQQAVPSAQEGKEHLSAAAISGIVLGSVAVLAVACATFFIARRYRRKSENNRAELEMHAGTIGSINQAITA